MKAFGILWGCKIETLFLWPQRKHEKEEPATNVLQKVDNIVKLEQEANYQKKEERTE